MECQIYPLLFNPNLHKVIWGGNRITGWKGLEQQDGIGESWEVSAVPGNESIVSNGPLAGLKLTQVIDSMPGEILGVQVAQKTNGKLPLLVKFIDAQGDLSIQVHPNDQMAAREHGKSGKSEMWYVLQAEPGACLYSGFKEELTPEQYKELIRNGTICNSLARHQVKKGDVFYIPAGRVHAIGHGIMLAEVQQSSDVTYRIFDYNRPGLDGQPRQLHTDLAAKALNFHVEEEYKTNYPDQSNRANKVIESEYFSVRVTEMDGPFHRNLIKYGSFIILMCLKGSCYIKIRPGVASSEITDVLVKEGYSCLIPATIADYDIVPVNGSTRVLESYIDNREVGIGRRITRFLHLTD